MRGTQQTWLLQHLQVLELLRYTTMRLAAGPSCLPTALLLHAQEVSNLLYGYGQLRHHHPPLMEAAERACTPRLDAFSTQDLVLVIWAHGMVKHQPTNPALLYYACSLLAKRKLMPLQIAVVIKGLAKIGFQPPEQFMQAMAESALGRLQLFKPVELCHLLWGFAHLGYRDVALFEAVVAQVQSLLMAWQRPLPQVSMAWDGSMAVMQL